MKINEIFKSIQGETSYAGLPCTFIRITGCNLRCNYCDTMYAYEDGTEMTINGIAEITDTFKSKVVCITGGEPLTNKDTPSLIKGLLERNYIVLVETNGSHDIRKIPQKAIKIMDIKCPDSNMSHLMHWENINYLTKSDEIKFVLSSRKDYDWAKEVINKYQLPEVATILLGTVFGTISPRSVVQWILEDNLDVRFQLQLHKYIWEPQTRGV
ncbi:MAG: radical SAM protein [Planctomycetia bacterium]|nr:radical SAM protein [Planctomycetia bacterium]